MILSVTPVDLQGFLDRVEEKLGLHFEDGNRNSVSQVLRQRLEELGEETPASYLNRLDSSPEELRLLAEHLTVTETFFFRNQEHLRVLAEVVLPHRTRSSAHPGGLNLLSAGCASGEEPYSMAIVVQENLPDLVSHPVRIRGIDMNPAMLAQAIRARFSAWSLRNTPDEIRTRYFRTEAGTFALDDRIRAMVSFEERNLTREDPLFWQRGAFDAVFCRNVLMYFSPEARKRVVARIADALAPGGYLFLGSPETLRGLSNAFHLCHSHDTFYYRRRMDGEPSPRIGEPPPPFLMRTSPARPGLN